MRIAILIIASALPAWAASDGCWTMTFRYPQNPVMLPSRCSTTCLRSHAKAWVDPWAKPQPQKEEPAPPQADSKPQAPNQGRFISGTPEKPAIDDFQEWLKSDPDALKRRAKEQRGQANEAIRNILDGNVPRTREEPRPEENE